MHSIKIIATADPYQATGLGFEVALGITSAS